MMIQINVWMRHRQPGDREIPGQPTVPTERSLSEREEKVREREREREGKKREMRTSWQLVGNKNNRVREMQWLSESLQFVDFLSAGQTWTVRTNAYRFNESKTTCWNDSGNRYKS